MYQFCEGNKVLEIDFIECDLVAHNNVVLKYSHKYLKIQYLLSSRDHGHKIRSINTVAQLAWGRGKRSPLPFFEDRQKVS